jgi:hypothetical protein
LGLGKHSCGLAGGHERWAEDLAEISSELIRTLKLKMSDLKTEQPSQPEQIEEDEGEEEDEGDYYSSPSIENISTVYVKGKDEKEGLFGVKKRAFEEIPEEQRNELLKNMSASQLRDLCKRFLKVFEELGRYDLDNDRFTRLKPYYVDIEGTSSV